MNFPKELLMNNVKGLISKRAGTVSVTSMVLASLIGLAGVNAFENKQEQSVKVNEVNEVTETLSGSSIILPFYKSKLACAEGKVYGLFDIEKLKDGEPYFTKNKSEIDQSSSFAKNYNFGKEMERICSLKLEGDSNFTFSLGTISADMKIIIYNLDTEDEANKMISDSYTKFLGNKQNLDKEQKYSNLSIPIVYGTDINNTGNYMVGEIKNYILKNYKEDTTKFASNFRKDIK